MDDFGKVVFLDVQKTGSTWLSDALSRLLPTGGRRFAKHARLDRAVEADTVLLTVVREPVAQWVSLYHFGCQWRGTVHQRLESVAAGRYRYDGTMPDFLTWLDFALDPAEAAHFPGGYARGCPALIGLQTHRFLRLNLASPVVRLGRMADRDTLRRLVRRQLLPAHVLRTESLRDDLLALCAGPLAPHVGDPATVAARIDATPPGKVTQTTAAFRAADVPEEVRTRIRDREWLMVELFYPGAAAGGMA